MTTSSSGTDGAALSPERHHQNLRALSNETFDVLVVGGGIVGAGAALDAATRGLRVALLEAQDWASGTSSRSSKLIHGGLRYLQSRDFSLVREALHERGVLARSAPHLVRAIPVLYPLRRRLVERPYVTAGVLLYDGLARLEGGTDGFPKHRQLRRKAIQEQAPALGTQFVGGIEYYDGQVDDARFVLTVVRTAAAHGAVVANRVLVTGLERSGDRIVGVRAREAESGAEHLVRARVVVSATGAWSENFGKLSGPDTVLHLRPSKGVHLVVPRDRIASRTSLIVPTERSVLFILPWGDHWIIGTTDTEWSYQLARPAATGRDIAYLLGEVNRVLADPLDRDDVEAVYAGIRPLIASTAADTTRLSREHAVSTPRPGLVLVSGGKYTTYRLMARDAIDAAIADGGLRQGPSVSECVQLLGAADVEELSRRESLAVQNELPAATAARLVGRYGTLVAEVLSGAGADSSLREPLSSASDYRGFEVVYAVTHEGARHLEDVLTLRTRLSIEQRDRGAEVAKVVAGLMRPLLGWSEQQMHREIADYKRHVAAELGAEREQEDEGASARLASAGSLPMP